MAVVLTKQTSIDFVINFIAQPTIAVTILLVLNLKQYNTDSTFEPLVSETRQTFNTIGL